MNGQDQVSIEEGKGADDTKGGDNGNGNLEEGNTNGEDAVKIGQSPDPLPSDHIALYVGGGDPPRSENDNNLQAGPNPDEFDVESLRSLRAHGYQGSVNSSQNSESQEDGQ